MPWGNVQFALIYDRATVPDPPRTAEALAGWIRAHPGRFTLPNDFAGMTFLKGLLYHFAKNPEALDGPFDEAAYALASAALWDYLRPLRPHFWRGGATYPASVSQLHRLFANGEIDLSMSNNDGEVDNKVLQGILPESARAFVPDYGSIRNSHYWGIPFNAPNKTSALVAANLALSPRAQYEKAKPPTGATAPSLRPANSRPSGANASPKSPAARAPPPAPPSPSAPSPSPHPKS